MLHVFTFHHEDAGLFACNIGFGSGWKLWMYLPLTQQGGRPSNSVNMNKIATKFKHPFLAFSKTAFFMKANVLEFMGFRYFVQRDGVLVFTAGAMHQGGGEVLGELYVNTMYLIYFCEGDVESSLESCSSWVASTLYRFQEYRKGVAYEGWNQRVFLVAEASYYFWWCATLHISNSVICFSFLICIQRAFVESHDPTILSALLAQYPSSPTVLNHKAVKETYSCQWRESNVLPIDHCSLCTQYMLCELYFCKCGIFWNNINNVYFNFCV